MRRILALVLCCLLSSAVFADATFTIADIRIEGLQRMSDGTVFNYLPLDPGDC
jgi:outer membrane protein insertion porin family